MAWGETPNLSLKQLSLPLPITQAAALTFPNIIGLYKYVTFFNNTAYQIALSGNGIPIFTCPAYKNITVQIPAAIHQMQQANYVAVWSGSTGIPANQAYLVFSENNLGLNIDLSPGAGTPGGTIDTDLLNILAALTAGYPAGRTPFAATITDAPNTVNSVVMPAVLAQYQFVTQLTVSFNAPVLSSNALITITPLVAALGTGAIPYIVQIPIGQVLPIVLAFNPAIRSWMANNALTITVSALGSGVLSTISLAGFYSAS
jgi:hypothetical protein